MANAYQGAHVDHDHEKKKKHKLIRRIIALLLLLLMILLLIAWRLFPVTSLPEILLPSITWDSDAVEGGLVQRTEEEIQEELNRKVQEGMIRISMNTSPVFSSGTAKGDLLIVNNETNNYPQVVYIVRKDTGEEIYRSGAIAVGSKIETAALDVPLPAGTYDCVAYFNNVDMDTGTFLGTAGAEITITVLS